VTGVKKYMKNNKAFTLVELLIVIVILAIIAGMVIPFVSSFPKLIFYTFVYFSIPASIFGVFLKLNRKYKWVVKKYYNKTLYDYKLRIGGTLDKDIVKINMITFTIIWPIYLPGIVAFVGGKEVYHRYLKNVFSIPEDKQ
jgi:prepilin-type N-terminal cleavage/methylation domain-containing protein